MPCGLIPVRTTAEDKRAATKERACTDDPLSAGSIDRIYRSAVYDTLQSVTIVSLFCTNAAAYTILVPHDSFFVVQ